MQAITETGIKNTELGYMLGLMGVQKLLNTISKYAGCEYGTGCSTAEVALKYTASRYIDYLRMRQATGYDMHNAVYLRPRDLEAAHNRMVEEQNKEQADRRLAEVAAKFPMIRENYRKLRNRYFYEDDTYLIRPARSAEEIVMEGRVLHHCVGGDNYLRNHDTGSSYILMLRFKEKPETPYITVEISGAGRITQWYGAHDKKPDEKNMQKWLDAYAKRLKAGTAGTGKNMEKQAVRVLLMAAG